MPLRHVVLVKLDRAAAPSSADTLAAAFTALGASTAGVLETQTHRSAGVAPGMCDLALQADFVSAEAFAAYLAHPDHQRLIEEILTPMMRSMSAIQYEV
jgi:hypothetical protein